MNSGFQNVTNYVPHKYKANDSDSLRFYFLSGKDGRQTGKCKRCENKGSLQQRFNNSSKSRLRARRGAKALDQVKLWKLLINHAKKQN